MSELIFGVGGLVVGAIFGSYLRPRIISLWNRVVAAFKTDG